VRAAGGNGDCWVATALYKYDKVADRFIRVFPDTQDEITMRMRVLWKADRCKGT